MKDKNALTDKIGMWVFLSTEIFFLAVLFMAFFVYRYDARQAFHEATTKMKLLAGTVNTAVLLTSSLCVVLVEWAYKKQKLKTALTFHLSAIFLGILFLFIKGLEYKDHIEHHLLPGYDFSVSPTHVKGEEMFFIIYFILTGFHALHLIAGLIVLSFVGFNIYRKRYDLSEPTGIELSALYWHFVDVVWIFIFPLLYLTDRQ